MNDNIKNNVSAFEAKNILWKGYAVIGLGFMAIYFVSIFIGLPVGDYNHLFGMMAVFTSVLWIREKLIWRNDPSYQALGKKKPKWLEWTVEIFPLVLIFFLVRGFIYEPFKIPSGSMEPSLYTGDIVIVNKFRYAIKSPVSSHTLIKRHDIKRGDIIVFKYPLNPQLYYIKRAIGLPGDTLEYRFAEKQLFINQHEIKRRLDDKARHVDATASLQFYQENLLGFEHPIQLVDSSQIIIPNFIDFRNKENCLLSSEKIICVIPQGFYFGMGDNRDNSLDSRFWGFIPEQNIIGTPDVSFNLMKFTGKFY